MNTTPLQGKAYKDFDSSIQRGVLLAQTSRKIAMKLLLMGLLF